MNKKPNKPEAKLQSPVMYKSMLCLCGEGKRWVLLEGGQVMCDACSSSYTGLAWGLMENGEFHLLVKKAVN